MSKKRWISKCFAFGALSVGVSLLCFGLTACMASAVNGAVTATSSATPSVGQKVPILRWPAPGAITFGTALSTGQLDATSSVPGTFAYSPAAGAVVPAGPQTLSVTFTPLDTRDYATAEMTTELTVRGSPNNLFVSLEGNDAWSCMFEKPTGAGDGPCLTLDHARALVAAALAQPGGSNQNFKVQVRAGTYYMGSPVIFGPGDSPGLGYTVTYEAYPNEAPVFSGGTPLTGWSESGGQWQLTLPNVASGSWNFTQLWVNDSRRFRPMLPSTKSYYTTNTAVSSSTFTAQPGDISISWENLTDVDVTMFAYWTTMVAPIASTDGTTVTLADWFASPTGTGDMMSGAKYRVENVKEALSQPGEWYLDRPTGVLTYIPEPGEEIDQEVVVAPRLSNLVIFEAGASSIVLRGLTFAHTQWVPPINTGGSSRNGVGDDAAIMGLAASNIVIDNCTIRNTGNGGIDFGPGTNYLTVENSTVADTGATGIALSNGLWFEIVSSSVRTAELRPFAG